MEVNNNAVNTVENQCLDTVESVQQEVTIPDQIYQQQQQPQQQPLNQMQNQPNIDRPTEIPAARVLNLLLTILIYLPLILKHT